MRLIRKIIFHASGHLRDNLRSIDARHRRRGLRKIGFHYVIRADGRLERGRSLDETGAHCLGYNADSVGICISGTGKLSPEQKLTAVRLVKKLSRRFPRAVLNTVRELDPWSNDPLELNLEPLSIPRHAPEQYPTR